MYEELKQQILTMLPDAIFDEQYGTGEIMIATGMVKQVSGEIRSVLPDEQF
jgi:hypothetical protein